MSNAQNDFFLENKREEFEEGDENVREAIIEELNAKGFTTEALDLMEHCMEDNLKYQADVYTEYKDNQMQNAK